jgi:hypothetical protein
VAHFAQLDEDGVVLQVVVVADADAGPWPGIAGEAFCAALLGGRWKQTSYNTRGGVHHDPVTNQPDGGVPRRMNYAVIGGTYDAARDAFIPPAQAPGRS